MAHAHTEVAVKRCGMDCGGFRIRERPISNSHSRPERKFAWDTFLHPCQRLSLTVQCNVSAEQLWAAGWLSRKTSEVGIFSTTRANRKQIESGTLRTSRSSIFPRSTAIRPNPPFCTMMSDALNACSRDGIPFPAPHRTQSRRDMSTPATSAEAGSKQSLASTSAQDSSRLVTFCITESSNVVLPVETPAGAHI